MSTERAPLLKRYDVDWSVEDIEEHADGAFVKWEDIEALITGGELRVVKKGDFPCSQCGEYPST